LSNDDNGNPFISFAQRQTLYRMTGDSYWLEKEDITKFEAGKQFALVKGKKIGRKIRKR
jgi:hypothetical protein